MVLQDTAKCAVVVFLNRQREETYSDVSQQEKRRNLVYKQKWSICIIKRKFLLECRNRIFSRQHHPKTEGLVKKRSIFVISHQVQGIPKGGLDEPLNPFLI